MLYEIWSLGHKPFEAVTTDEVCLYIAIHQNFQGRKLLQCSQISINRKSLPHALTQYIKEQNHGSFLYIMSEPNQSQNFSLQSFVSYSSYISLTLNVCTSLCDLCFYCLYNYLLQVIEKIESGYRLPPPPGCSRTIYRMMVKCWYVI